MPKKELTAEFKIEFVPLPPERREAYYAALRYLLDLIREEMMEEAKAATSEEEIKIVEGK